MARDVSVDKLNSLSATVHLMSISCHDGQRGMLCSPGGQSRQWLQLLQKRTSGHVHGSDAAIAAMTHLYAKDERQTAA